MDYTINVLVIVNLILCLYFIYISCNLLIEKFDAIGPTNPMSHNHYDSLLSDNKGCGSLCEEPYYTFEIMISNHNIDRIIIVDTFTARDNIVRIDDSITVIHKITDGDSPNQVIYKRNNTTTPMVNTIFSFILDKSLFTSMNSVILDTYCKCLDSSDNVYIGHNRSTISTTKLRGNTIVEEVIEDSLPVIYRDETDTLVDVVNGIINEQDLPVVVSDVVSDVSESGPVFLINPGMFNNISYVTTRK